MQPEFAKEMQIRRHVESIYNKTSADFEGIREWGDYEEEKEDIIYNLSQGIDVEDMQQKLAAYQKANSYSILQNQALKAEKQRVKSHVPFETARTNVTGATDDSLVQMKSAVEDKTYQPSDIALKMHAIEPQIVRVKTGADSPTHEKPQLSIQEMGLICGWTPDLQHRRGREEAYDSLLQ